MDKIKTLYSSPRVTTIHTNGPGTPESAALGWSDEQVNDIYTQTLDIIDRAHAHNLGPSMTLNSCMSVILYILNHEVDTDQRALLISAITEALCASAGGGSDNGTHHIS